MIKPKKEAGMRDVKIKTVLGPISPEEMGGTLVHEHICYGCPGWKGDQMIAPAGCLKANKTFFYYVGMHLTPVTAKCNVPAYG